MAKLRLEELYNGDEYKIHANSVIDNSKNYGKDNKLSREDEIHILILLIVKHTVSATVKIIKQGDFIEDYKSPMKSLFYVKWNLTIDLFWIRPYTYLNLDG